MTAPPADLQQVLDDINAADRTAEALAASCTDEQFHWRPQDGEGWSIAQCLDHLATISEGGEFSRLYRAPGDQRSRSSSSLAGRAGAPGSGLSGGIK